MTYIKRLAGEEDNFIKLRQVAKEVIDTRSLGGPPAVSPLRLLSFFLSGFSHKNDLHPMRSVQGALQGQCKGYKAVDGEEEEGRGEES